MYLLSSGANPLPTGSSTDLGLSVRRGSKVSNVIFAIPKSQILVSNFAPQYGTHSGLEKYDLQGAIVAWSSTFKDNF